MARASEYDGHFIPHFYNFSLLLFGVLTKPAETTHLQLNIRDILSLSCHFPLLLFGSYLRKDIFYLFWRLLSLFSLSLSLSVNHLYKTELAINLIPNIQGRRNFSFDKILWKHRVWRSFSFFYQWICLLFRELFAIKFYRIPKNRNTCYQTPLIFHVM